MHKKSILPKQNIVVFGGAFNPPTLMHYRAAKLAQESLNAKVLFVPVGDQYEKSTLINSSHRVDMLHLLCKNNPMFEVNLTEVNSESNLTTTDTLNLIQKEYKGHNIFFLTGADNLSYFTQWNNWDDILQLYNLAVIPRKDFNVNTIIESTELREYKESITILPELNDCNHISSTLVRDNIKKNVTGLSHLIEDKVEQYIYKNKLYKEG